MYACLWSEHFYRLLFSRCNTEKDGGKGKGHWIDNRTSLTAVQPGAIWTLMACAGRGAPTRAPPPHRIKDRFWQPRPKVEDGLHFGDCEYGVNLDSNSDHVQIFSAVIGHLEAEIDFLSFHRIWWKFARGPKIWTPAEILTGWAGRTSRYSTGETTPIKVERSEPSDHLRSTCLRGNTSTRIWTRALQPDQEEVSSWRFCRAQIVSVRQTFPLKFWLGTEILPRRGDFNDRHSSIVRLNFTRRLNSLYPPKFC